MLNVLCCFSSISVIICSILVMIGHVRETGHMYQFAVSTSGDLEIEYYIKTVEDMHWVCLAPDRKVWKAPLNVIMSIHIV